MKKELDKLKEETKDRDGDSKEEIDSLKNKLVEQESDDDLYYDSLQHNFDLDHCSLYSELYKEKKKGMLLELKNKQITCMFWRKLKEESEKRLKIPRRKGSCVKQMCKVGVGRNLLTDSENAVKNTKGFEPAPFNGTTPSLNTNNKTVKWSDVVRDKRR